MSKEESGKDRINFTSMQQNPSKTDFLDSFHFLHEINKAAKYGQLKQSLYIWKLKGKLHPKPSIFCAPSQNKKQTEAKCLRNSKLALTFSYTKQFLSY